MQAGPPSQASKMYEFYKKLKDFYRAQVLKMREQQKNMYKKKITLKRTANKE